MDIIRKFTRDCFNQMESMMDAVKTRLAAYDFSQIEREMKKINDKWDEVKNAWNDQSQSFSIHIPYNADTQFIKTEINGNRFKVSVKKDVETTRSNVADSFLYSHISTIPSQFINGSIAQKYLEQDKAMLFIFKKPTVEVQAADVDELIDAINETNNVEEIVIPTSIVEEEVTNGNDGVDVTASTEVMETIDETVNHPHYTCEDALDRQIWELYCLGTSYRKIAKEVGVSDKTVARRIKKMLGN